MLETIVGDLRFALRGLRRTPAFTLVAVGSLALGVGANTAIFSFVNAILLKRLPVPEPQRLVRIEGVRAGGSDTNFSYPFIAELDKNARFFDGVLGRFPVRVNLMTQTASEPLHGEVVTGGYFSTLRVKPALGRLLGEEDISAATGNPVCVISYSLWRDRFNADPHILGRTLILNTHPYRVIGVTERGFHGAQLQSRADMQLPVSRMGDFMGGFFSSAQGGIMWHSAGFSWLEPLARLKPGVTAAQAQAMLIPLANQLTAQLADPKYRQKIASEQHAFRLTDGSAGANSDRGTLGNPLLVLMGIAGLIVLVACMNIANLLLARARAREQEFALRLSLGAGRWRLIRQLMAESLAIAISGGALGLLLSVWLRQLLLFFFNEGQSAADGLQLHLDPAVLLFSAALSLTTALLFGLAPAWQSAKTDILPSLKGSSAARNASYDRASLRKLLIIVQLAFSVCLLFAAGLLTGSLRRLETVDLGFRPAQVVALSIDPAMAGYHTSQINAIFDEVLGKLNANPAVAAASYATVSPLEGSLISLNIEVPGHTAKASDGDPGFNDVSPAYFSTLQQRLLLGRDFSSRDTAGNPRVAIVNELFVARYLPGRNPIGFHFKQGGSDVVIVGVVGNALYQEIRETPRPTVYLSAVQSQSSGYTLLVRVRNGPKQAIPQIEHAIRAVSPKLPIYNVRTLQSQIDSGISSERILGLLSTLFGALATLLCAIGLYGIIAYGVTSRTREIGIRGALGSTRQGIAALFLREGGLLILCGTAAGIPLALASSRLLGSLLFGLEWNDPTTLVSIIAILGAAGALAVLLPAWRAARLEPVDALRQE
ncbi:MAG: ABC transporter permease [Acidobacteriota bacterium]|nr:ABC transporter permease [Acidobacteriota bacterium]